MLRFFSDETAGFIAGLVKGPLQGKCWRHSTGPNYENQGLTQQRLIPFLVPTRAEGSFSDE